MEFDRELHAKQLDNIAELAYDPETDEITGARFAAVDWSQPDSLRLNAYRLLGQFDYQRPDGSTRPMWAWFRPCNECSCPLYAITVPWDIHCRWLHYFICRDCASQRKGSQKAEKRRERFAHMRDKARADRARDPARQQALLTALGHFQARGIRVSRAPQSPDYLVRLAINNHLITMAKATARDVMERLIRTGRIEEFEQRYGYGNGGPVKRSLRFPGNQSVPHTETAPSDER